jgi:AcrR family transcriptional regulator
MSRLHGAPGEPEDASEGAPPRRVTYHHGDLRRALLKAAEAELEARGVEAFSLRRVAKRAGVSHAAPAHHFGDVGGLLTALAADGFERLVSVQAAREAEAAAEPDAQLLALGVGYVAFAEAHPALFRLMFASDRPDHRDERLCAAAKAAYGRLVERVTARVRAAGAEAPSAVDVMAAWSAAHGLADLLIAGQGGAVGNLPPDERAAAIEAVLRRATGAAPG